MKNKGIESDICSFDTNIILRKKLLNINVIYENVSLLLTKLWKHKAQYGDKCSQTMPQQLLKMCSGLLP